MKKQNLFIFITITFFATLLPCLTAVSGDYSQKKSLIEGKQVPLGRRLQSEGETKAKSLHDLLKSKEWEELFQVLQKDPSGICCCTAKGNNLLHLLTSWRNKYLTQLYNAFPEQCKQAVLMKNSANKTPTEKARTKAGSNINFETFQKIECEARGLPISSLPKKPVKPVLIRKKRKKSLENHRIAVEKAQKALQDNAACPEGEKNFNIKFVNRQKSNFLHRMANKHAYLEACYNIQPGLFIELSQQKNSKGNSPLACAQKAGNRGAFNFIKEKMKAYVEQNGPNPEISKILGNHPNFQRPDTSGPAEVEAAQALLTLRKRRK